VVRVRSEEVSNLLAFDEVEVVKADPMNKISNGSYDSDRFIRATQNLPKE
jgi:hypothetical protein